MTPEQLKELEDKRREREEELILLFLLLLGLARREIIPDDPEASFRRVLVERGVPEFAESMADAHLDVFPIFAAGLALPDRIELIRLYTPTAGEAVDAMVKAIAEGIVEAGGDVSLGLRNAGYSAFNTNGLELGAERNIVTATNAGLLAAAIADGDIDRVTGLEHLSTIDDSTTAICEERHRLRLPLLHPYWRINWPSLHFRCRSIVAPLTGEFAASATLPTVPPMEGFGVAPPVVLLMLDQAARAGRSRGAAA